MSAALLAILITGGAASADDAVVALVRADALVCTGTIIAPHAVLTAAHCLAGDDLPVAVLGDSVEDATVRRTPVAGFVHPQFDASTLSHDVAILVFADAFTAAPVPLATDTGATVGSVLRVVGYGWTVADDTAPAVRRTGTSQVTAIDADGISTTVAPSQTCDGDSGGPALATIGGLEQIVGVASSGDTACAAGARHARVDRSPSDGGTGDNARFLADRLAATAEHAASAGARCWYAANCAVGACTPALDDPRLAFCEPACTTARIAPLASDDRITDRGRSARIEATTSLAGDDGTCPAGLACTDGLCRPPVPSPGAAGSPCTAASDCIDGLCLANGDTARPSDAGATVASATAVDNPTDATDATDAATVCTRRCFTDIPGFECPDTLVCEPAADGMDACFPAPAHDDGGGCRITSDSRGSTSAFSALALLVASRVLRPRRSRRRPERR